MRLLVCLGGRRIMQLQIHSCRVESDEGDKDYLTCLPEEMLGCGLPSEAIVGTLHRPLADGEAIAPENVAINSAFVDFMHGVIARRAPQLPGFIAEARRQGEGLLVIVDLRTQTPDGPVPPHDIVGCFRVAEGAAVVGSYRPSPKHRLLTENGFFQLHPELQAALLEELRRLEQP